MQYKYGSFNFSVRNDFGCSTLLPKLKRIYWFLEVPENQIYAKKCHKKLERKVMVDEFVEDFKILSKTFKLVSPNQRKIVKNVREKLGDFDLSQVLQDLWIFVTVWTYVINTNFSGCCMIVLEDEVRAKIKKRTTASFIPVRE